MRLPQTAAANAGHEHRMRARRLAGFRIWALLGLVLAVAGALLVYYQPTIELAYFDLPDDASVDIPDGAEQVVSGWWILLVVLPHRPRVVRRAATKLTEYRIALTDVLDLRRSRRQDIRHWRPRPRPWPATKVSTAMPMRSPIGARRAKPRRYINISRVHSTGLSNRSDP